MQTFLPFESFIQSAASLDKKRGWKQVVETKQTLCTLRADNLPNDWKESNTYKNQRWIKHPAVAMWQGYEEALKLYFNDFLKWAKDVHKINTSMQPLSIDESKLKEPWWLGDENMHRSHRARLIEKLPEFYEQKWPEDKNFNGSKYFWPVNETKTFKII